MAIYVCNPEDLRTTAKSLRNSVVELQSISDSLTSCVTSLGGDWMGSAAAAFMTSYHNRKQESLKYLEVIIEFADLIDYAASRFEQADKTAGHRIGTV